MPVPNGLDEISRRFERRPRSPLPTRPRHPVDRPDSQSSESVTTTPDRSQPAVAEPSIDLPAAQRGMQAPSKPLPLPPLVARLEPDRRPRLSPLDPTVNLGLRIPRPLDDRLADLLHELRSHETRSSKVEVLQMLLWELPSSVGPAFRDRLERFRAAAGAKR
jgi:hypothetical protein